MTISIIHPSYGRPALAFETAKKWIDKAGYDKYFNQIEYLMCITTQDPKEPDYVKEIPGFPYNIRLLYYPEGNMVKQMNYAAQQSSGDLLIAISDDFDCPENWFEQLTSVIAGQEDICIKTDDGVRNPGIDTANIIALPMMDRKYYNRFGYIYHPAYNHFYGDEELSRVADKLGRKVTVPILFEHIHYMAGKAQEDDTNRKNNKFFQRDKVTFIKRQRRGFKP